MPLQLSKSEIASAGGLLATLALRSAQYIGSLAKGATTSASGAGIRRHIVHTDPHLDEYFAELLFRSCMGSSAWQSEFVEQSIFSKDNDFGAQQLWPDSAIFGIGRACGRGKAHFGVC
jgi:hypothetical protein